MFEVIAVRRQFLTKLVTFKALEPASGVETLISGGPHALTALEAPYQFAMGFTFELKYPFWASLAMGQKVPLKDILAHPFVRRELFSKARQLARS